jgi:hypothetical protein
MTTSLPKSKQWKLGTLAILPYDVDVTNDLSVAGKITATGGLRFKVTAVTAAGSDLSGATQLSEGINVVGGADDSVGVKLPATPAPGTIVIVKTTVSAKALKVYPDAAATINAISSNGAITQAATTAALYFATSTTQWYTLPLLPS